MPAGGAKMLWVDALRKRSWGVNGGNVVSKGYDILPISPTAVAMKPKPTPLGGGCYHHPGVTTMGLAT